MPLATINGQVFFSVHVPKCGGTSVEELLTRHGRLALDFALRSAPSLPPYAALTRRHYAPE